jgi:hypothetical protein
MRELPIRMPDLLAAMDSDPDRGTWFLDLEFGTVRLLSDADYLAVGEGELSDGHGAPDFLAFVGAVMEEDPRWVPVPTLESWDARRLMERFASGVPDETLALRLSDALSGRGAHSRFRRVLEEYPAERVRWLAFKDAAIEEEARDWLHTLGVHPVPAPDDATPVPPPDAPAGGVA